MLALRPSHPLKRLDPLFGSREIKQILLPSARHLEEGRGTTILELLRRENCMNR